MNVFQRPWYRLHWVTWLVGVLMIGAFVNRQFEAQSVISGQISVWNLGWPFGHQMVIHWLAAKTVKESFAAQFMANCLVGIALAASTVFVLESWLRSKRRLQFSLRHLMAATAILGILLATSSEPPANFGVGFRMKSLASLSDLKNPIYWPLLFGLACTIYSSGWFALSVFRGAVEAGRAQATGDENGPKKPSNK